MRQRSLRGSVPRDIGSILLRDVGFGVTFWNSNSGGRGVLFPEGSIGYFWSGAGYFMDGERDVSERLEK